MDIQKNVPLAPYTTFKIGGPAKYFAEVSSEEELLEAAEYAKKNNLEVFVLSGGSNILVSDQGFDGLVICMLNSSFLIHNSSIQCDAGLALSYLVKLAADNSLSGLEWAAGIPGTVGGAVRGNAGAYGGEIKDNIESVKVLKISNSPNSPNKIPNSQFPIPNKIQNSCLPAGTAKFKIFTNSECNFSYRNSIFKENKNLIIISCVLNLQKGEKAEIENKMKEIIKKRSEKTPRGLSVGSFFQNPKVENRELIEKFEKDTGIKGREGRIPAGWLIEEAGLLGKKIGGAAVSGKHCNFVINQGQGRAEDVVMLASFIKQQVRSKLGVQLKEEVQYVGF